MRLKADANAAVDTDYGSESFGRFLDDLSAAPEMAVDPVLASGTMVDGNFEIRGVLGRGGMGIVYLAQDHSLDREVALKMIRLDRVRRDQTQLVEAFEREARATARLRHPNIVTVHHFGRWRDQLYLVLERLRGETLAERLTRGALPITELLDVAEQILTGLAHAHDAGLLHKDLKPHNVFLEDSGQVRLLDFGLATLQHAAGAAHRRELAHAGTPTYMAPEQWRGEPLDERADVWAVGVVIYEMATGFRPFAPSPERPLAEALDFARVAPRPPAVVARPLEDALAFARDARTARAAALLAALRLARRRARQRRYWQVVLGVAAFAALAAGVAWARHAPPDPEKLDLSGDWVYEPAGVGVAKLERLGPTRYRFRYSDGALDDPPAAAHFYFSGELRVERRGGHLQLAGTMRDLPGSRFAGVGEMTFDVVTRDRLWMSHSRWGPRPGAVTTAYEPWALVRRR